MMKPTWIILLALMAGCHCRPERFSPAEIRTSNGLASLQENNRLEIDAADRLAKYISAGGTELFSWLQSALKSQGAKLAETQISNGQAIKELTKERDDAKAAEKKAKEDASSHTIHSLEYMGLIGAFVLAAAFAAALEFKDNKIVQMGSAFGGALIVLGYGLALIYRAATLAVPWIMYTLVAGFAIVVVFVVFGIITRKIGFKELAADAKAFHQPDVAFSPVAQNMLTALAPHTDAAQPVAGQT